MYIVWTLFWLPLVIYCVMAHDYNVVLAVCWTPIGSWTQSFVYGATW